MPQIPLEVHRVSAETELGVLAPAYRMYVTARFLSPHGRRIPYPTFIDIGAPYSVIPHRLARQIQWSSAGKQLVIRGKTVSPDWFNIPCEMGQLEIELGHRGTQFWTRPLHVLAKVAIRRAPRQLEDSAILGLNFLLDNHVWLEVDGSGQTLSGLLIVP